jgi:hypothetical protein
MQNCHSSAVSRCKLVSYLVVVVLIGFLWFGQTISAGIHHEWNWIVLQLNATGTYHGNDSCEKRMIQDGNQWSAQGQRADGTWQTYESGMLDEPKTRNPLDTVNGRIALALAALLNCLLVIDVRSKK